MLSPAPFRIVLACLGLSTVFSPARAQRIRLAPANAILAEEFSAIRGVRELPDGRILVSDYIDQRVVLVDLERQTVVARVTQGGGPREARLPTRLIPMPGDSTILVDLGNSRLLVLDQLGVAVRTISGERPGILGVRGVDTTGAFYFAIPGWTEARGLANDSVRIVKWSRRGSKEETLAIVQGERMRSDIREPARTPRIPTVGYAEQDGWVVNDAGVLRVVRAGGYRVETRSSGVVPLIGPSYAYITRQVNAADRLAFVRRFLATSPTSGKGPDGGMGYSPQPSGAEAAALARGTQFAERHPMFNPSDVLAAPGGRLWVGRPTEDAQPVLYDVFDEAGRRLVTVELAPGRRVMALGRASVYVVVESELGVQQLERYPLPR